MNVSEAVERMREEINGKNRKDVIGELEKILVENVEELSKNDDFFHFPLTNILSLMSKVDFSMITGKYNLLEVLHNFVKGTINAHFKEKGTIMLLQGIDIAKLCLSYDEIYSIIELFTNCPILKQFCKLHKENQTQPEIDYDYELHQKDEIIKKLQKENAELLEHQTTMYFSPINEKPEDFEQDMFKACKEGKLSSVQWLIEKEGFLPFKKLADFDCPIHIATRSGHLPIVQYLVEIYNVDIDSKGYWDRTPLHFACQKGHLPIVQYLVSKGADLNAKDKNERTPLYFASINEKTDIVEYLRPRGALMEIKKPSGKPNRFRRLWRNTINGLR